MQCNATTPRNATRALVQRNTTEIRLTTEHNVAEHARQGNTT